MGLLLGVGIALAACLLALAAFIARYGVFPIMYAAYIHTPIGPHLHRKALERTRGSSHSSKRVIELRQVVVVQVPFLDDNYAYLIADRETGACALVDPADAERCEAVIEESRAELARLCQREPRLELVLCTHRHWDHAGGNRSISSRFPGLRVVTGERDRSAAFTHLVRHGDALALGTSRIEVLETPCHTRGHVCFYLPGTNPSGSAREDAGAVFTGDTLFAAGTGKFFEGTAADMVGSLSRLMALPASTLVMCGHEYSLDNLRFAAFVDPGNAAVTRKLAEAEALRADKQPVVPTTIGEEREQNPFVRAAEGHIQLGDLPHPEAAKKLSGGGSSATAAVALLRKLKDDAAHRPPPPAMSAANKKA